MGAAVSDPATPGEARERPLERPLRIVVADDQASVREGLEVMLDLLPDIEVVATASDGVQAIERVGKHHPDAILLDLRMPVLDGTDTTQRLTEEHPDVAVVILTTYADDASVVAALRAGARGYLTKDADRTDIARTLHAAVRGQSVLDPAVRAVLVDTVGRKRTDASDTRDSPGLPDLARALPDQLTAREAQILVLIAQGLSNPEIAARLYISGHTVKTHVGRVFTKTGSRDRAAAVLYAHRHHLVT